MGKPLAKQGDRVVALDTHYLMIPSPAGPILTPTTMPFDGVLSTELSPDVLSEHRPAATKGTVAMNMPPHMPIGGPFQNPPGNKGTVKQGSGKVLINGKEAAFSGSTVTTCNDPADADNGAVDAKGTVLVGE